MADGGNRLSVNQGSPPSAVRHPSSFAAKVRQFFETQLCDMPGYERREEQLQMAEAVARALEEESILVVEAGTGTGKSLAYLVPGLLWALRYGGPIVVSTRTLNLQQQLMDHDLPRLRDWLPEPPKVVPARGWSNYVCLRRLYGLPGSGEVSAQGEAEAGQLAERLNRGASGVRQHLQVSEEVWSRVCCESTACAKQLCPFYAECYLFKERRELETADVVVTNHSLVMADLALRQQGAPAILPRAACLVLDEAHHLEDVATDHLGRSVGRQSFKRLAAQLYEEKARTLEQPGLLPAVRMRLTRAALVPTERQRLVDMLDRDLIFGVGDLYRAADEFFHFLEAWFPEGELRLLLTKESLATPAGEQIREVAARFGGHLERMGSACHALSLEVKGLELGANDASALELAGMAERLKTLRADLEFCLFPDSPDWVYWAQQVQAHGTIHDVSLTATPLDVGERLADELFAPCRSLVLTSATLAIGKQLSFYEERVGLKAQEHRLERLCLDSPFDYLRQSYLGVVTDLPEPGTLEFLEQVAPKVAWLVRQLGGRTFLLATSYSMLRQLALRLEPLLAGSVNLLLQGQESNAAMLERFRSEGQSLLLGTDSFWEGVDVPGDALQCVILARLPFRVPTDPVVQAHCKRIEDAGQSSFSHYQLPQAILKMRQGFGRLIRTGQDRGIVLVLDNRLYHKSYGPDFVRSLPGCVRRKGGLGRLVQDSLRWLREEEAVSPVAKGAPC